MEGSGRIRKDAKESAQQGTARHVLRGAAELRRSSGGACRHCALRKFGSGRLGPAAGRREYAARQSGERPGRKGRACVELRAVRAREQGAAAGRRESGEARERRSIFMESESYGEAMNREQDDPRKCPVCGQGGKRPYRNARYDGLGIRFHYRCPLCGVEWDVALRRVGKAKNPVRGENPSTQCG